MKQFSTQWFLLALLVLASAGGLRAQQERPDGFKIKHPFTYANSKKGTIEYWIYYNTGSLKKQYQKDPRNVKIDMGSEAGGTLIVELKVSDVDDKYSLVFPTGCIRGTPHLKLKPASARTRVLNEKKDRYTVIEYEVMEEGSGVLDLGFDATERPAPGDCALTLAIDYRVKDFISSVRAECEQARTAFNKNPESISPIKKYLNNYRGGACAGEFRGIEEEFNLYQEAKAASEKKDCDLAKEKCRIYLAKYPNGHYNAKISDFEKCTPAKTEITTTTSSSSSSSSSSNSSRRTSSATKCDKAWDKVKNETCPKALREFVQANPKCERVQEANEKIDILSRSNFNVEKTGNSVTLSASAGQKLRWKDLSPERRLKVSTPQAGQVEAKFEGSGKYVLYVQDECGRDTTVELSSDFYAKMETLNKGNRFVISIVGGQPPYSARLLAAKDAAPFPLPSTFSKNGNIEFTKEDLNLRGMKGLFTLEVKDSGGNAYRLKEGIDNQRQPVNVMLLIISLLLLVALGLLSYLLFAFLKNRKRKETIYDIQY